MQHVREIDGAAAQAMRGASQCNNRFPGSHVPVRRAKVLRGPRVANWSRDLKEYIRSVKFGERLFSIIEADDGLDPVLMGRIRSQQDTPDQIAERQVPGNADKIALYAGLSLSRWRLRIGAERDSGFQFLFHYYR